MSETPLEQNREYLEKYRKAREENDMEEWRDIKGYEGVYQISNIGRVKSLSRWINNKGKPVKSKTRILKNNVNGHGYYQVILSKNLIQRAFRVHQLVAFEFMNHTACGMKLVVDHINHIRTDNRVDNLQVITQSENIQKYYDSLKD